MSTIKKTAQLHTFFDIFSAEFPLDEEVIKLKSIIIPKIQRDYAQGRENADVNRVRERFLSALKDAIEKENITLDFIYGDIDEFGRMTPLDGQQRLTTLFLLHVYAAKKAGIAWDEYKFLLNFSYETRESAREFCANLVEKYTPSFTQSLKTEIIDQHWFPLDWQKDPTVQSMLVMLDAIDKCFADVPNIWARLKEGAISFYFLLIKDMGLTDELYIKMNSRGKPLTQFEHFKAELEHNLREIDESMADKLAAKIDIDWTHMLWQYHGPDNITDDEFLRYFHFVCDIICYQAGGTPQGKSSDEFDLLAEYFSKNCPNIVDNVHTMISLFDCWCNLDGNRPRDMISRFVSQEYEPGKIKQSTVDIFEDCLRNYADIRNNGNRRFPLHRIVLLFAFVTYLQNREHISDGDFARRLRIINNLLQNSEDDISDSVNRSSGNRMPAILKQVAHIVNNGLEHAPSDKALNITQFHEELEKENWLQANSDKAESLFFLEDHSLLYGQISIVGLTQPELFPRFHSLFSCSWDLVDCALMTIGVYGQKESGHRYQFGSSSNRNINSWQTIFHKSKAIGDAAFENTKRILHTLLEKAETFTDEFLQQLIADYIQLCEEQSVYPFQYYYVKYPHFRPGSHGKYTWDDQEHKPYEMSVLRTPKIWSEKTYQPFLKTIDDSLLSEAHKGQRIVLENVYIICTNQAYVVCKNSTDEEVYRLAILQNENGIDTENRIEMLRTHWEDIRSLNRSFSEL